MCRARDTSLTLVYLARMAALCRTIAANHWWVDRTRPRVMVPARLALEIAPKLCEPMGRLDLPGLGSKGCRVTAKGYRVG